MTAPETLYNTTPLTESTCHSDAGFLVTPTTVTTSSASVTIDNASSGVEREILRRPFGFKGAAMSELWQTAVHLDGRGVHSTGLAVQGTLWSDAAVFACYLEEEANRIMYRMTCHALSLVMGKTFASPLAMIDEIFPLVQEYGQSLCPRVRLRKTFVLNSLVALDNAAWLLYARQNHRNSFDEMIPREFYSFLPERYQRIASIPLISYNVPDSEIRSLVENDFFFLKIKIGQQGTQEEMLNRDAERVEQIHALVGNRETPYTKNGFPAYYLDANGRYETKELLLNFLDRMKKCGAYDRIILLEEPFPEELAIDVHDIPVRIAADESVHTTDDVTFRARLGYGAIALKGIAKTLSRTLLMGAKAHQLNLPCFCADLTVNPILIEWNKCLAARLTVFPGLNAVGLLESNGRQNYTHWDTMLDYDPCSHASWSTANNGFWNLNDDYYQQSGGIFIPSPHYDRLTRK